MARLILATVALALALAAPPAAEAQKPYTSKSFTFDDDACAAFLTALAARNGIMQAWKALEEREGKCNSLDKAARAQERCRTNEAFVAAYNRTHDEVRAGGERVVAAITSKTIRKILNTVWATMAASEPLPRQIFEWKKETGRLADFLSEQPIFPTLDELAGKPLVTLWAIYDETLKAACRIEQDAR